MNKQQTTQTQMKKIEMANELSITVNFSKI